MNIPFGKRQLVVEVERTSAKVGFDQALIQATDREIEQIARNQHRVREPRWEIVPSLYGWYT